MPLIMPSRIVAESWRDLRLAFRALRATPIVTLVTVASLALGIGANTAIFALIDGLLLRSLPVKDPSGLVLLTDTAPSHVRVWSYPVWTEIQHRPELFERSAAWSFTQFNLASRGEAALVDGIWASGSLFDTLGVQPLLGRTLSEADDRAGGGSDGPVIMISYGFWQRRFGGAPDVLGRSLTVDDVPFTIVGVTPPAFSGPEVGRTFDIIAPIATEPLVRGRDSFLDSSGTMFLTITARLKSGQSIDAATAGLRAAQPQIRNATLMEIGRVGSKASIERYLTAPFVLAPGATGYSGARDLRGTYGRPLLTMMVVVALLLLIACVNVANLLVARAAARRHELGVRLALGASRGRLIRQLFTESGVLYVGGAAAGLALGAWGSRILVSQLSTPAFRLFFDLSVSGRVLAFTIAITALVTILFGTMPAFRASSAASMDILKTQGRSMAAGGRNARAGWLVGAQIALSLVLVDAAGLFIRTFVSLTMRPLGFEPSHVLIATVDAHRVPGDASQRLQLYERARDSVRALPDVTNATLSLTTPVGPGQFTPLVEISGVTDTRGPVWSNLISPGWFETFGTPIVAGRDLTDRDRAGAPRVTVVNEAFARKFFAGTSPLGRTLTLYPHTRMAIGPIEIVGVAGDAIYSSLRAAAPPTFYIPLAQFDHLTAMGIRSINLSIRSKAAAPSVLATVVATTMSDVNPHFALTLRPLTDQINGSLVQERLLALLSGCFGVLALLLAALGLYGVMADAVASRRTEIGIRMALGAPAARVVRLVVGRLSFTVVCGVVVGLGASIWASRFVGALVYGLEPADPATLAGSIVLLISVASLAAWLPTRRAVHIDPASVLREG
jgi:putative ABC transport system permease protein